MAIDSLFFPTFHADISLFDTGVSRFENDPYFYTARMEWAGVEYVLVMEEVAELWWLSPQLRWRLAGNQVLDVALRWETIGGGRDFGVRDDETFSWIDGFVRGLMGLMLLNLSSLFRSGMRDFVGILNCLGFCS
ncbi:hypothetical protein CMUST_14580 [Corynebacterium mustelae]|uniref:Uncharacterized protein n=1 Tax=Corynebacterium mustelae TaxID=571915 RepID=A0A0G3H1D7_9CORY|nr:hypothetical protein [Corynebacterium mustelae]AKK07209.1 hypothetical protein CMUST_14580 [Corynebacterium mustelae]